MNRKVKNSPKERMICFCYSVSEQVIIEAIRAGCTSLMDIRHSTYASTGCAGCSEEVKKLLKKYAVQPSPNQAPPKDPKVSNG